MILKTLTARLLAAIALVGMLGIVMPQPASAGIVLGVSVDIGPPALPYYEQPVLPGPGYVWTPGYWAYGSAGYYWVPGTWVQPPEVGYYWTPGYWAFDGGRYTFNQGYWATSVGFYGGVNYGYGYYGDGYVGGRWSGRTFEYNTAVTNVNTRIVRNYYVDRAAYRSPQSWNHVSYNGGPHGIGVRPSAAQLAVARGRRFAATTVQVNHVKYAANDRSYRLSYNNGHPRDPAVEHPFSAANRAPAVAPAVGAAAGVAAAHAAAARYRAVSHTTTGVHSTTASAYHAVTHATQPYRAPATTYHAPATTYHAPATKYHATTTYHAPATTYRAPTTTYHAPATTYHAPAYHAPATTYHAPTQTYHAPLVSHAAPPITHAAPAGGHPGGHPH